MKRTVIVAAFLAVLVMSVYVAASISSEIGLNFQVNTRLDPMYNIWFDRYWSGQTMANCQWVGARGLIVYAETQSDVSCFHQANPNIITVTYLDRGVYTTDPLYQALSTNESAWLHWQNGVRASFTFNNNPIYLPNPSSTAVRNWESTNLVSKWKTMGVDGIFLDDGYYPCSINSVWKICTPNGQPLAEFNNGDYLLWVRAWSSWANWVKSQIGKPFHIYPNAVAWYTTINSTVLTAWTSGMDGGFLEYSPTPNTYQDSIAGFYQMQSSYYSANPKAIIDFFPYSNQIPSLYWLAAYYLLAKNFTTNNLYLSPPFNYPVPQGFCCEGWNTSVWDKLILGNPSGPTAIVDAFGDGTASLYIRIFQHGVVVAMQHRATTDTRTVSVNLGGPYVNVTNQSGPIVSNITLGVNNAFIGVIPGSQAGAASQAAPVFTPWFLLGLGSLLALATSRKRP